MTPSVSAKRKRRAPAASAVLAAFEPQIATLAPEGLNGTNRMQLYVFVGTDQARLVALLDNLGKGASGAAVQNLNLMFSHPEGMGIS